MTQQDYDAKVNRLQIFKKDTKLMQDQMKEYKARLKDVNDKKQPFDLGNDYQMNN
jgi:hypothetical protein